MGPSTSEQFVGAIDGTKIRIASTTASDSSACAVLCHGITGDVNEFGLFPKLADKLAEIGISSVSFDYRGHGASLVPQRGTTIAGEMLDLHTVLAHVRQSTDVPLYVVASSFGAVSVLRLWPYLGNRFSGAVFWNPVIDVHHTFVEPTLPWGLSNMTPEAHTSLRENGFYRLDGEFEIGTTFHLEMTDLSLTDEFACIDSPTLVLHAAEDSQVSSDVAKQCAERNSHASFVPVPGSDHGFSDETHEDFAVERTVEFLGELVGGDVHQQ